MRIFQGCIAGREIAMTRKGANQHTEILVAKSATTPPADLATETTTMNAAEVAKAATIILSMNDVTKAHYLALPAEGQAAFLEKTPVEMADIAKSAKEAADKVVVEAEAAKTGRSEAEVAMTNKIASQQIEIDALKAGRVESDIEKRARDEFDGFPGGTPKVVEILKSLIGAPAAAVASTEGMMKSQIELAKRAGANLGFSPEEVAKAMPATAKGNALAMEVAKSKGIPLNQALGIVWADEANAELFAQARAEEASTRH